MDEQSRDEVLWQAVCLARPAVSPDAAAPVSGEGQPVLERVLASREAPRRRVHWSRHALRIATAAMSACVVLAIAAVALIDVGHRAPRPPATTQGPGRGGALRNVTVGAVPRSFVIVGSGRLIAQAPDPRGGPPWGVREIRTSAGQVCLTAGRVEKGNIGVLGVDGAWGDDRRFHRIPLAGSAASLGYSCGDVDANGNAFINVQEYDAVANAAGGTLHDGNARGAAARAELCPASSRTGTISVSLPPRCPPGALRDLAYGVLGPEAVSITYVGVHHQQVTEPTSGPDGGYLIVAAHQRPPCAPSRTGTCSLPAEAVGPLLQTGMITAVRYRSGRVCRLPAPTARGAVGGASCPLVGYKAPATPNVSPSQVAAPVRVNILPAAHYCVSNAPNPPGCAQVTLKIAFTARVAVRNRNSYYEAVIRMPPRNYRPGGATGCPGAGGAIGPTGNPNTAGQRVLWRFSAGSSPKDCRGNVIEVTVAYVANSRLGLNGIGSKRFPSPGRDALIVGRTRVRMPTS